MVTFSSAQVPWFSYELVDVDGLTHGYVRLAEGRWWERSVLGDWEPVASLEGVRESAKVRGLFLRPVSGGETDVQAG